MIQNLIYIILSFFFVACNTTLKSNDTKIETGYINYIHFYNKDSLIKHINKLEDYKPEKNYLPKSVNFEFDSVKKSVHKTNRMWKNNQLTHKEVYVFDQYQIGKRDSLQYLPQKILNFKLQGTYTTKDDDIDIYCFYLNPQTKDVIMILHEFYIGNIDCMFVFVHEDKNQPFKGNMNTLNSVLRLSNPVNRTNHIKFTPHIVDGEMQLKEED